MQRVLLCLALLVAAGCSSRKPVYFSRPERTVAIIPPFHVKPKVWEGTWPLVEAQMSRKGFTVLPRAQVQAFYDKNKFTIPAEITQYSTQELAKELGAEMILYTKIIEWKEITLLVYNKFRVKAEVNLHAADGTLLYNRTGWATKKKHLSARALAGNAFGVAGKAIWQCFRNLPPVPPPQAQNQPPPE